MKLLYLQQDKVVRSAPAGGAGMQDSLEVASDVCAPRSPGTCSGVGGGCAADSALNSGECHLALQNIESLANAESAVLAPSY